MKVIDSKNEKLMDKVAFTAEDEKEQELSRELKYRAKAAEKAKIAAEEQLRADSQKEIILLHKKYLVPIISMISLLLGLWCLCTKHYMLAEAACVASCILLYNYHTRYRIKQKLRFSGSSMLWLDKRMPKPNGIQTLGILLKQNLLIILGMTFIIVAFLSMLKQDYYSAFLMLLVAGSMLINNAQLKRVWS